MRGLEKIGTLTRKSADQIGNSRLGIGFEKLDRNVFDPEPAYDKLAQIGVKWVRLQSGWQRTERVRGVYDFSWLDSIVDRLLSLGMIPWICLCYGNELYNKEAETVFGAVGIPPIFNDDQKTGWRNYVTALVSRYRGKVGLYEVWNEPDGKWCWKHGVNATELGLFTIDTAKAVKAADPSAKVAGPALAKDQAFLSLALSTGMAEVIDAVTYHAYLPQEADLIQHTRAMRSVCDLWNPSLGLIQGESGTQSRSDGAGALKQGEWDEKKQAKYLLRHLVTDLSFDVRFASWFSTLDMIEALNGTVGDRASYLDYGYFGVLGADFDEDGRATGTYTPKPSYYALSNLASLFADAGEPDTLSAVFRPEAKTRYWLEPDLGPEGVLQFSFKLRNGSKTLAFWHPSDVLTTDYEGTVSFKICRRPGIPMSILDPFDGSVYQIGEEYMREWPSGCVSFTHVPIKDYPL
ncbi:MAG: beta-galactosidase, partial [Clostridia bacterium]|nr:beta-galactosidase [Clostridia bacterium]